MSIVLNGTDNQISGVPGQVLQVVTVTFNDRYSTTSTSWAGIGPSLSITPRSTSSRILLMTSLSMAMNQYTFFTFLRNGTNVSGGDYGIFTFDYNNGLIAHWAGTSYQFVDSPNTTSTITYQIGIRVNSSTFYLGDYSSGNQSQLIAMEISA